MKRLIMTFVVAGMLVAILTGMTFAGDRKYQLAVEYLELSKSKETLDLTIETYVQQLSAQNPQVNPDMMRDLFNSSMSWPVIRKSATKIVSENYTEEELMAINKFLRTKEGRSMANKSPEISSAMSRIIAANISKTVEKLQTRSHYPDHKE